MEKTKGTVGLVGVVLGSLALCATVLHFRAGPLEPPEPVEVAVADKAVKIRDAVVAKLKGKEYEAGRAENHWGPDRIAEVSTIAVALVAIILGVIAYGCHESVRMSGTAAVLGGAAIGFQYLGLAIGLIFIAILVAAVLNQLGIDVG